MMNKAKPIWIFGKDSEMNFHAVFEAKVPACGELHIAATVFYRIFVNGRFVCFGPARTAKGYMREDIYRIEDYCGQLCEQADIIIEVMSYQCRSLSTVLQPPCLMAEVIDKERTVAYTGKDFEAFIPECRVRKAERYSIHRYFCEIWDYSKGYEFTLPRYKAQITVLSETPQIIDRVVPYPKYQQVNTDICRSKGSFYFDETLPYRDNHYPWEIPAWWGAFPWDEIPYHPYAWIQRQKQCIQETNVALPVRLHGGEYVIFDLKRIEAGFLNFIAETTEKADVVIGFSEYYHGEMFTLPNMDVHNVMEFILPESGRRELSSFEPFAFRFVMFAVKSGCIAIEKFGVRTYEFDISDVPHLDSRNETLNTIYSAAVRTFAHNAVDLYTDCPSRERAGWLCDSYFTAKAEFGLTGRTVIEDAFLQNYRLYKNEGDLPKGMLPEAYPSDVRPGTEFIPQWALWYILEVEEYIHLRGHKEAAEKFRKNIYGLLEFFHAYENEYGLLEKLPSRNFVEWSDANKWTWDVNFPTNFLYAQALECVYKLYGDTQCKVRSDEVREAAVRMSFNGSYFVDHAVRDENGNLQALDDCSEACQYYAVLFAGVDLDSERFAKLKHFIFEVFTPGRKDAMPYIVPVNAFIGAYLRIEVLLRYKKYELLLSDICDVFGAMGKYTGTLWENRQFEGSYDHGFASYAAIAIKQAMIFGKNEK